MRRAERAIQTRRDFPEIVAICDGLVAQMVKDGVPLDIAKGSVKIVKLERSTNP